MKTIDMTEAKQHIIYVTGARNIRFKGVKIAYDIICIGTGMHAELTLYKTTGGNFVCNEKEITQWQGEEDLSIAKLVKTEEEIIEFFGLKDNAKNIYLDAGIDCCVDVD